MENFINFAIALVPALLFGSWLKKRPGKRKIVPVIGLSFLIFLACYPWTIGENIYSLFGGVNKTDSVYSIVAVYQDAKKDAVALSGCGAQNAGEIAYQTAGIAFYQKAKQAVQGFGVSFYQKAKENAIQIIGINFCQIAGKNAVVGFGIPLYQKAKEFSGISWQKILETK